MRLLTRPGWVGVGILSASVALGQDYSVLRINEVIAENDTQLPLDIGGNSVDMVEIFNSGDVAIDIGFSNPNQSLALSDSLDLPPPTALWTFRDRDRIFPGDSLIIFLDGNDVQNNCEPHANFNLASDGSEPITLWGPMQNGQRAIIDQVWLPPLPADVSFGRSPDGAGPAPVPLEDVLDTFVFFPPGESTFGIACIEVADTCTEGKKRLCRGRPNGPGGNIAPRVERLTFSTNSPAAGDAVLFTARVEDEKEPLPGNIASVEIVYRVNLGPETTAPMVHDGGPVIHDVITNDLGEVIGENPFNVWTIWEGSIPGQPQGSVVDFFFRVTDAEGLTDTSPEMLCADGVGPCHRDFGGPGCTADALDEACKDNDPLTPGPFVGARFIECRKRFQYTVGYTPPGGFADVVINEVLASHDGIYLDATERPCNAEDMCPTDKPECCKFRDDLIEILNTGAASVDLSGKWLSSSPFGPEAWQFPPGSILGPGQYIRVWLDNDGKKCPNPDLPPADRPCFWECPDPTNAGASEYHANFSLAAEGDQIYLFDSEDSSAGDFGVIHGVVFGPQELNQSLSLVPNGSRQGSWLETTPTILLANPAVENHFRRGDADGNCGVDITDAVYVLNYLFSGGDAPPCLDAADPNDSGTIDITDGIFILNYLFLGTAAPSEPGPDVSGTDPTPDDLVTCTSSTC